RLPPDEAYFCSDDHLKRLAIRELRQLELTLAAHRRTRQHHSLSTESSPAPPGLSALVPLSPKVSAPDA
ncbi:hypothetical protein VS884_25545, partial [Escherichia coli]